MKPSDIPHHLMTTEEFFSIDRIETAKEEFFKEVHRHSFYELLWFIEAGQEDCHWIDFKRYAVKSNQIYILTPNQAHRMDIGNKKGYVMTFSLDFFNFISEKPTKLLLYPYFYEETISFRITSILKKIIDLIEIEHSSANRRKVIQAYSSAFLLQLSSLYDIEFLSDQRRVTKLLALIENNYIHEKEVQFYANHLALSVRRINEISVANTGKTIKQLLSERLITEAKRLIAATSLTFSEIAYQLHFNEPAYFTRFFKQKTDQTPQAFRTQINTTSNK